MSDKILPTREKFVDWAKKSLLLLGKRPSHFLDNGKDSGKNRTSVLLSSKQRLNMVLARQLQLELQEEATRQGIQLPLLFDEVCSENSIDGGGE